MRKETLRGWMFRGAAIACLGISASCAPTEGPTASEWPGPEGWAQVPTSVDLGVVPAEQAKRARIPVENVGEAPFTVEGVVLLQGRADAFVFSPASRTLEPGEGIELELVFYACPDLWTDGVRRPDGDACACFAHVERARLEVQTSLGTFEVNAVAEVESPAPELLLIPDSVLELGRATSLDPVLTASVTLVNVGCGTLTLAGVDLVSSDLLRDEDFSSPLCPGWPCLSGARLCSMRTPDCTVPSRVLPLTYQNRDGGLTDLAQLSVQSDDPLSPERLLVLRAEGPACRSPRARVQPPGRACVGQDVVFRVVDLQGGSGPVVSFDWQFAFSPGRPPALEADGDEARFTPTTEGFYFVTVALRTACGATTTAVGMVSVGSCG